MTNKKDSEERQVVSRERVAEHGEVYTAKREVNADEIPDVQERLDHILHHQVYGMAITELTALVSRRSIAARMPVASTASVVFPWLQAMSSSMRYSIRGTMLANASIKKMKIR